MMARLPRIFTRRAHKFAARQQIIFIILYRSLNLIITVIIVLIIRLENRWVELSGYHIILASLAHENAW